MKPCKIIFTILTLLPALFSACGSSGAGAIDTDYLTHHS
jgi:hypothetical protein